MKVIILGCGPTGLLAAYACEQRGHEVVILSKKVRSKIPGAVFLHEYIPELVPSTPDGYVEFIKRGSMRGYAKKVYGSEDAYCSWSLFPEGERPAWSMFALYSRLWEIFHTRIMDVNITTGILDYIAIPGVLIISTIPANVMCKNSMHTFVSQNIFVLNKTAEPSLRNGIVYNGDQDAPWYRTSRIFGAEATEATVLFPSDMVSDLKAELSWGYKPINTDCDCHPYVARVGRFGRWEKGILVHHAYKQTVQLLEEIS